MISIFDFIYPEGEITSCNLKAPSSWLPLKTDLKSGVDQSFLGVIMTTEIIISEKLLLEFPQKYHQFVKKWIFRSLSFTLK